MAVTAVNGFYVWIVLTQSLAVQVVVAVVFVVYKLVFMYLVLVPWMERVESKYIVTLTVILLNVVIIPMLATLAVDVSCFESLFTQTKFIVTDTTYSSCAIFVGTNRDDATCAQYLPSQVEVIIPAPFIYSDQCFTAVLTNYIPVYVLTYGVIGLLVPIIQIVTTIYFANAANSNSKEVVGWMHSMKHIEWFPIFYLFPLESVDDLIGPEKVIRKHFYLSRYNSLNCVLLLTILLSFGVTYAPLAIMLLLNITLTTLAFQLSIYYHSEQIKSLPPECLSPWCAILTAEVCDMHKIIFGSRTAIYIFSSMFVTFGLYDMAEILNFPLTISLMCMVFLVTVIGTRLLKYRREAALKEFQEFAGTFRASSAGRGRLQIASFVMGTPDGSSSTGTSIELTNAIQLPSDSDNDATKNITHVSTTGVVVTNPMAELNEA